MAIFTATFSAVAVSVAQDVFELLAPADSRVAIREIRLGQYSDFGDAQAEILSIQLIRGYTTSGSGGTTPTPVNISGHANSAVSTMTVEANNTTVASAGTPLTVISDVFNVAAGWWYYPPDDERPILEKAQRLVVRITAPADALTMNATIVFEERGQIPA